MAAVPDAVVTIVVAGVTASAVRSSSNSDASLGDGGEVGSDVGTVYVSAATVASASDGSTITVDGNSAFVTGSKLDPAGAVLRIDYRLQRPK